MARQSIFATDMVFLLGLESALGTGSGASITLPAAVNGVVPAGTVTVASGGTGYLASKTVYVRFSIGGNDSCFGTVTTSSTGVVTSAVVLDGGAGYTHTSSTAATIKAAPDAAYGTGVPSTQLTTDDAILIGSDMTISYEVNEVKRDVLRGYLNNEETLRGENWCTVSFGFEICPSGGADAIPAWGNLFRIFGMAESITAGTKVEYNLVSTDMPSGMASFYYGGVRHNMKGIRGLKLEIDAAVADVIKGKASLLCMDMGMSSARLVSPGFANWVDPIVITDGNTADLKFGCTYNASTGAISGGTSVPSMGLKLTIDNTGKYLPMLGGSGVVISGRKVTAEVTVDQLPSERVQAYNDWKGNATTSIGFSIGNVVGYRNRYFLPRCKATGITPEKQDGKLLSKIAYAVYPTVGVGNDELRCISM